MNKRGITLVEIIVSVALISIVLVFLLNIYTKLKITYDKNILNSEYEVFRTNIINAVGLDINEYGFHSVTNFTSESYIGYKIEFSGVSDLNPVGNVIKYLLYNKDKGTIMYGYYNCDAAKNSCTENYNIAYDERFGQLSLAIPNHKDSSINVLRNTSNNNKIYKMQIEIVNARGNHFDINIFAIK